MDEANSDPFEEQIVPSGPDGRFGLQTEAPSFVGRQTTEEYERARLRDNMVNGGVHTKQVRGPFLPALQRSCQNNSHDGTTQTNVDDHEPHARSLEGVDHDRGMDIDGSRGGLFDFDDEQFEGMWLVVFSVCRAVINS